MITFPFLPPLGFCCASTWKVYCWLLYFCAQGPHHQGPRVRLLYSFAQKWVICQGGETFRNCSLPLCTGACTDRRVVLAIPGCMNGRGFMDSSGMSWEVSIIMSLLTLSLVANIIKAQCKQQIQAPCSLMTIPVLVIFHFHILTTLPLPCGKGQHYDLLLEAGEVPLLQQHRGRPERWNSVLTLPGQSLLMLVEITIHKSQIGTFPDLEACFTGIAENRLWGNRHKWLIPF